MLQLARLGLSKAEPESCTRCMSCLEKQQAQGLIGWMGRGPETPRLSEEDVRNCRTCPAHRMNVSIQPNVPQLDLKAAAALVLLHACWLRLLTKQGTIWGD